MLVDFFFFILYFFGCDNLIEFDLLPIYVLHVMFLISLIVWSGCSLSGNFNLEMSFYLLL